MTVEPADAGAADTRERTARVLSARALRESGLGVIQGTTGGGAVFVSARLTRPAKGLHVVAHDPQGQLIARKELIGDERVMARLAIHSDVAHELHVGIVGEDGNTPPLLDVRVERRPDDAPYSLPRWERNASRWHGDTLEIVHTGEALSSPTIETADAFSGEICFEGVADTPMVIGLWLREVDSQTIAAGRYWMANGPVRAVTPFRNLPPGRYAGSLVVQYLQGASRPTLREIDLDIRTDPVPTWEEEQDTYLPRWSALHKFIHRACKRSAAINAFVQGLEFRLGRDELMSVPRYMSFCPTGQCNALCDFCSVTHNRTGIIKKQIDNQLIDRFTRPVQRTVAMYGLEGNGEPTLHREFKELVQELTRSESEAYLITNGSRFSEKLLPTLMRLESVNVSLNAATDSTHRAVMKLKEHDTVIEGLKRIVQARGFKDTTLQEPANPRVSVSFVVTRQNAHEVEQFLTLAEDEIGADVAFVRPLSELGNELGSVEDLRDIVPYMSDVQDVIDAIADYESEARRKLEIRFDAEAFKSVRPDPIGRIARPPGFEDRLLAPRPKYWTSSDNEVCSTWRGARAFIKGATKVNSWSLQSAPIFVVPNEMLQLHGHATLHAGKLELFVEGQDDGDVLWRKAFSPGADGAFDAAISVQTRQSLRLVLRTSSQVDAELDFGRLRSPRAPSVSAENALRNTRWEAGVANAELKTSAGRAQLRYAGSAGPYIAKSYAVPTEPGSRLRISLNAQVAKGALGVGVLSADQSRWLATTTTRGGNVELEALTGQDHAFRLALFAAETGELEARLDLSTATIECDPIDESEFPAPSPPVVDHDMSTDKDAVDEAGVVGPNFEASSPPLIALDHPKDRRRRLFCHKPWTDLHNFSVDGRMDVCCIATGPSQERYALGNLREQKFQDVWNGPTAKLFRRTVNSDKVLPPCARCPMGYSYQGMWFDREYTLDQLEGWVWQFKLFQLPILRRMPNYFIPFARRVVGRLVFRRFKRPAP